MIQLKGQFSKTLYVYKIIGNKVRFCIELFSVYNTMLLPEKYDYPPASICYNYFRKKILVRLLAFKLYNYIPVLYYLTPITRFIFTCQNFSSKDKQKKKHNKNKNKDMENVRAYMFDRNEKKY